MAASFIYRTGTVLEEKVTPFPFHFSRLVHLAPPTRGAPSSRWGLREKKKSDKKMAMVGEGNSVFLLARSDKREGWRWRTWWIDRSRDGSSLGVLFIREGRGRNWWSSTPGTLLPTHAGGVGRPLFSTLFGGKISYMECRATDNIL